MTLGTVNNNNNECNHRFMAIIQVNLRFIALVPLLKATSAFGLGRRR